MVEASTVHSTLLTRTQYQFFFSFLVLVSTANSPSSTHSSPHPAPFDHKSPLSSHGALCETPESIKSGTCLEPRHSNTLLRPIRGCYTSPSAATSSWRLHTNTTLSCW